MVRILMPAGRQGELQKVKQLPTWLETMSRFGRFRAWRTETLRVPCRETVGRSPSQSGDTCDILPILSSSPSTSDGKFFRAGGERERWEREGVSGVLVVVLFRFDLSFSGLLEVGTGKGPP